MRAPQLLSLFSIVIAGLVMRFSSNLWNLYAPYTHTSSELSQDSLEQLRRLNVEIDPESLKEFWSTGVVVVKAALPPAVISDLGSQFVSLSNLPDFLYRGKTQLASWYAWVFHSSCGQFSAQGKTAGLAAQFLNNNNDPVRLVNSVVYRIGSNQGGAEWHQDGISFKPLTRESRAISLWVPLQAIEKNTPRLAYVPGNISLQGYCVDGENPSSECWQALEAFSVSVPHMQLGDVLVFDRSIWHRTLPGESGFRLSYTERWTSRNARFDSKAYQHSVQDYVVQPLCQYVDDEGSFLHYGDFLAGSCFPLIDPARPPKTLPSPMFVGTSLFERVKWRLLYAHASWKFEPWWIWFVAFVTTQLVECPVYMLVMRLTSSVSCTRGLMLGFICSCLTHPLAVWSYWEGLERGLNSAWLLTTVEVGVYFVEAVFLYLTGSLTFSRACLSSFLANSASVLVGHFFF